MVEIDGGCPGAAHAPFDLFGSQSCGPERKNRGKRCDKKEKCDFFHFFPPYVLVLFSLSSEGIPVASFHLLSHVLMFHV
jgi:hypothetical protein